MKPELVTIQKVRLLQLGGAALGACAISFYAGYCYRGPDTSAVQLQEQAALSLKAANEAQTQVVQRLDPEQIQKQTAEEAPKAQEAEEKRITRVFEKAPPPPPPAKAAPPAIEKKAPPAPAKPAPAPKPDAKEKEKPKPSGGVKYTVQVASFKEVKDADKLVDALTKDNFPAYSQAAAIKGEKWYRVRVGQYATAEEAKKVSAKLNSEKKLKSMALKYE